MAGHNDQDIEHDQAKIANFYEKSHRGIPISNAYEAAGVSRGSRVHKEDDNLDNLRNEIDPGCHSGIS